MGVSAENTTRSEDATNQRRQWHNDRQQQEKEELVLEKRSVPTAFPRVPPSAVSSGGIQNDRGVDLASVKDESGISTECYHSLIQPVQISRLCVVKDDREQTRQERENGKNLNNEI